MGDPGPVPGRAEFAADDGSVPPEVSDVLARRAAGAAGIREVVGVLAAQRLLVPLLEVDADQLEGDDADPCAGQDRAVAAVSVRSADGTLGLAFTGTEQLRRWRPEARPMPVAATRVAQALLQEGAAGLVVDPAGGAGVRIPPLALARLAAGGDWPDPWVDPAVRQAVGSVLAPVLGSGQVQVRLAAPDDGGPQPPARAGEVAAGVGLLVEVRFPADLAREVAEQRATIVAERLSGSEQLREVFDGLLAVRVV